MTDKSTREKLTEIAGRFSIEGSLTEISRITAGHINTAYHIKTDNGSEYAVQEINTYVFPDPESLMRNIAMITETVHGLRFLRTGEGKCFVTLDDGGCWRVSEYVKNSVNIKHSDLDAKAVYLIGKAFGNFDRKLCGLEPSLFTEVIPHFHDTILRLNMLDETISQDPSARAGSAEDAICLYRKLKERSLPSLERILNGNLPLHVTHNDTKPDNVLFDKDTLEPLCVIDLDTCMPGLYCHDFGDMIRGACAKGGEDSADIYFDPDLYKACGGGYLSEMKSILKESELNSLSDGVIVMTLELASRFLEDYLAGDRYFRTEYPGQNLMRARSQFKLLNDMLDHAQYMKDVICSYTP